MSEALEKLQENYRLLQGVPGEKKYSQPINKNLERVVMRLSSFSQCAECNKYVAELNEALEAIIGQGKFERHEAKELNVLVNKIMAHFEKGHSLLPEGYYMSTYMSIGLSLGIVFGLVLFDNIGIGLALGLGLGVAIGAGLDADAKKKDKVI